MARFNPQRTARPLCWALAAAIVSGCAASGPPSLSPAHLQPQPDGEDIPAAIAQVPVLPPPQPTSKVETYTVVVNDVPVKELLFQLARDAKLNIDIHSGVSGAVTLNAVAQTLPQILDRIAKQVDLRYQLDGPNLVLSPDAPYWRTYHVNYLNMARETSGEVKVATEIATTGGSVSQSGGSAGTAGNKSNTSVKNTSSNDFWATVEKNLIDLIRSDKPSGGKKNESPPVVSNPISGMISVFGTQRQHEQVQRFLDQVVASALRQVLIEMTIVEVELSDRYQAGVDWQALADNDGFSITSALNGAALTTTPLFALDYQGNTDGTAIAASIRMLETFGDVKVLSSPKIMAINNQTALLKVVDEHVYFTVELEIDQATNDIPEQRTFTTTIHTVPVGLVMNVTPQINKDDNVTLSIRPTISRITGFATDPTPRLTGSDFDNLIPQIQVSEMESMLQVASGRMVVMGGLMQNKVDKSSSGVPLLANLPMVGNLFRYRDEQFSKTELVIFLRPTVIRSAGLDMPMDDYSEYLSAPGAIDDAKDGS